MVCYCMRFFCGRCSLPTPGYDSIGVILLHLNRGHDPSRTVCGGRSSCDSGGTGFWHETYFMSGGMEAVYDDMVKDVGLLRFAPVRPAQGPMFSARTRARQSGEPSAPAPVSETEFYS